MIFHAGSDSIAPMKAINIRLIASICLLAASGLQAAQLASVRLLPGDASTQAILELDREPANYKVFNLANPDRLVLDLPGSKLVDDYVAPAPNGPVTAVRTGRPTENNLRVVLDLGLSVTARTELKSVNGKIQLIVDLLPKSAANNPPPAKTVQDVITKKSRDLIIAIDAGHGGKDPGAIGPSNTYEKDITLKVSKELAARINAERGMKAFLVRDSDVFIPLDQRYMKARQAQADLFVSVHADAAHSKHANGTSVYVLSLRGASSEAARWLADKENASDLVGGISLDHKDKNLAAVLLDLSQNATMRASDEAANHVLDALRRVGKTHKPQVERANFVVLRSPDVPSMLIETGFITNPQDEKKLRDPDFRKRLADVVVKGVRNYFSKQPPPGTWFAANSSNDNLTREHVVSRGETLSLIAAQHGVGIKQILAANDKRNEKVLVGERLQIPGMASPQ